MASFVRHLLSLLFFVAPLLITSSWARPPKAVLPSSPVTAFDWTTVPFVLVPDPNIGLPPGLTFTDMDPVLTRVVDKGAKGREFLALLVGEIAQARDWSLLVEGKKVKLHMKPGSPHAKFKVAIPLSGKERAISIMAINASGQAFLGKAYLRADVRKKEPPRWVTQVSLGSTYVDYTETNFGRLTQIQSTGKLSVQYFFVPGIFDLGVSTFFTVYPHYTKTSVAENQGTKGWFVGVNGRVGYTLPFPRKPFTLRLLAGGYWTNFFAIHQRSDRSLGFTSMVGLQLFPNFSVSFGNQSIYIYFKFCPVFDSQGKLSFTDTRELAAGTGWNYFFRNGKSLSLSLDVAQFEIHYVSADGNDHAYSASTSYSLGVGLGF